MASESDDEYEPASISTKPTSRMKISNVFLSMGLLAMALKDVLQRDKYGLEMFAGVKAICKAFNGMGMNFSSFEIQDSPDQDVCSLRGFVLAAALILQCLPDGVVWFATVCSTWVFMSKSSTGRHLHVLGNGSAACHYANIMVHRVALLCELATTRAVKWVLDQPRSITMQLHPRRELMLKKHEDANIHVHTNVPTYMGAFGGESQKCLKLSGTAEWLPRMKAQASNATLYPKRDIVRKTISKNGTQQVTGGKDLKSTQAYTNQFGLQVAVSLFNTLVAA